MPPGFPEGWDDLNVWNQAQLLGFNQVANHDENPPIKGAK